MANAVKGEVRFTYKKQPFVLVFDHEAIASFEDDADLSIFDAYEQMAALENGGRKPKLSMLGRMLKAGLARHHPALTLSDCMGMVTDPNVFEAIAGSGASTFPEADGDASEEAEGQSSGEPKEDSTGAA